MTTNKSNLTARQQTTLGNKLTRHAKNNCANFIGNGECPLFDMCVVQIYAASKTDVSCAYFEKAVLPTNPELEAEYNQAYKGVSDTNYRTCIGEKCNSNYIANSNAQKYCAECATNRRKKKEAKRLSDRHLNDVLRKKN